MKKISIILILFILTVCRLSASFDLQVYKTDQFTLLFPPGYEDRAALMLSELEAYKTIPEKIVGNKIMNLPIILEDAGQYSQGYANPVYFKMALFNYDDTEASWFRVGMVHEYTHMLQMLKKSGAPTFLSDIFGDILSPNVFAPNWMFEGITTYNESQLAPYTGRLNDSGFESFMGMLVSEGKAPELMKASYSPFETPFGNAPYIYGGEFFGYLSKTYGEEKFSQFFESYGASLLSYFAFVLPAVSMDNTFREVYGKSTEELWKEWSLDIKEKYKNYKMEGEKITNRGFYTDSPVIYEGALYYINNKAVKTGVFDTWGFHNVIQRNLKTGEEKEVISRPNTINAGLKLYDNKIYYSIMQLGFPYPNRFVSGYGYDSVLFEKDMKTGEEKELFEDCIDAFCVTKAGTIIYSKKETYKYGSKIILFDTNTKSKKELFETPYTLTNISATENENSYIVSARLENENSGIFSLNISDKALTKIIDTPWTEDACAVYENKIFYSSNENKSKRIYYYDMTTKAINRLTENGIAHETAFDEENNEVYFVGLNLKGFDIYKKKLEPVKFSPAIYPIVDKKIISKVVYTKGSYLDNLATLYPKIRYPYLDFREGGKYAAGVGLAGMDAAEDFSYDASVFYDSVSKKAGIIISMGMYFLDPVSIGLNYRSLDSYFDLSVQGPVFVSSLGGLSGIRPALAYAYMGANNERQLMPSVTADFNFTLTNGSVFLGSYIQETWLGSNKYLEGYKAELNLSQYLCDSELKIKTGVMKASKCNSDIIGEVRGYSRKVFGKNGIYGSAEVFKPLLELHGGLWNPNIFFQDLVASVFVDGAFTEMESNMSYGAALHLETELFFNVPIDIGIRGQFDNKGNLSENLIFKVMLSY